MRDSVRGSAEACPVAARPGRSGHGEAGEAPDPCDRDLGRVRLSDDRHVTLSLQPAAQTCAHELVVVDEQDPDRHQMPSNASKALVPPCVRGMSSIVATNVLAMRRWIDRHGGDSGSQWRASTPHSILMP